MADLSRLFPRLLLMLFTASSFCLGDVHIEEPLQNVEVLEGERAKFVCKVRTLPAEESRLRVQWKHNGDFLTVERNDADQGSGQHVYKAERNRHTLIVRNTRFKDSGVYTCIAAVGDDTDMASAHLRVKGPPSPPVNVEITSCHGNTAELQWEGGPENWATVTRYIVQFNSSVEPVRWHDYYEQFPAGSRRALVVLSPWGTYSFRVKAVNDVGVSKPSSVTSRECTTPPDRPDSNPKNVRTRTDVKNTLVVEWNPIDRLYFNGPGFRYDVYWRRKGSLAWEAAVVHDPLQTQFRKEVTDVYGLYEVQVRAANDLGESHQPAFVFIGRSGEAEPLVVPKDFRLNPNHPPEAHKAYFIWEAVNTSTDLVQGKFCGYKLRYWKSVEGRHKQKEVDFIIGQGEKHGPDMRVAVADLPAYTALRAQVSVMNTHYSGPPSQTIDFFTPEGAPSAVRELHVEAYGVGYVLLKWLPPDQPNGLLQGYDIAYQPILRQDVGKLKGLTPQINNPSTLGARISGLHADHQYRFYVWA
ncbi:neuroglian-like [Pomacea canaliculata]|uniref:neuroglian-like n=1 Tax=Pomacea canaliculata TaxID=400727 RepID=UPI000D72D7EE|nr:neuroglian-like [Pomacea canaliculata]XP_025107889.1 neuroglian-like [Pomacea canaliculata]XP_025107890.1 neuroglian-like [Pomacea canaliculata]XP_025107891.1 neuroglian-like [Pomacea canaliculata]XP_025107892.1 neuroglian-like [Pomacea canaliculata]